MADVVEYPPFTADRVCIQAGQFPEFPDFSSIYESSSSAKQGHFTEGRQATQQIQLLICLAQQHGLLPAQLAFRLGKDLHGKYQLMPDGTNPLWWPQHVGRKLAAKDFTNSMKKKQGFMALWEWLAVGVCSAKGPGPGQLCGALIAVGQRSGETAVSVQLFGRCVHCTAASPTPAYTHEAVKQYLKQQERKHVGSHSGSQEELEADPGTASGSSRTTQLKRKGEAQLDDQLAEVEQQYQNKLREVKQLELEQEYLADKSWVMEQVMAAHDAIKLVLKEVETAGPSFDASWMRDIGATYQDITSGGHKVFMAKFKQFQQRIASALLEAEQCGQETPELIRLCDACGQACRYLVVLNPESAMFNALHVNSATDGSLAVCAESMPQAPKEHWALVAQATQLSTRTLGRCHVFLQLLRSWQSRLQAERHVLSQALADCSSKSDLRYPSTSQSQPLPSPAPSASSPEGGVLAGLPDVPPEDAIAARMSAIMEQERNLILLLSEVLYCRLLNNMELARVMTHAYPYVPDDLELFNQWSALYCQERSTAQPDLDLEQLLLNLE